MGQQVQALFNAYEKCDRNSMTWWYFATLEDWYNECNRV